MSTSTSTAVHFSTPKKQNPNPHPYAIKTTSTALLSRNSSLSSTASATHHYIPPSSPSPSPTQTGFGGEKRDTRHRYNRSLTSELPRPLPAPPSVAAALGGFDDDDNDTPRRKVQRAYSLPQGIELPEDPKRWTPTEVSLYLTSSGAHDLPTPVAHDIATLVKDKKITGKTFLRLNEVDLEEYGINQLWRTTLVDASRALRRNTLHGRIWGNHTERDNNEYDDDNNLSSNSNFVITNRKRSLSTTSESRGRVRDMVDTLERSSSASSSDMDEEGSCTDGRRIKDTRSKRDKVHHYRHRSLEQQQQGRLPQRGSVNNLFGTSGPGPETSERDIEDKDSTITAHARRTVNGNERRLLPFPPTTSNPIDHHSHGYSHILTPSHTGTSHPLPPSPGHARNQHTPYSNHVSNTQHQQPYLFPSHSQPPNTFDFYELGFKNSLPISPSPIGGSPIRSPNSQRYVVQHNINVKSSTPGGNSSGGRLLPYPPIVGEAELFHPRPRMGLGVGGLASGLEDGSNENGDELDGAGVGVGKGAKEGDESAKSKPKGGGEEGYIAMPETPVSGNENEVEAGFESETTDGDKGVKDPEKPEAEPSILDLLLGEPQTQSRAVSGVDAWEMELGETVKRINSSGNSAAVGGTGSITAVGGSKTRTRPRKREMIMGEIGRKSGRMSGDVVGLEGGKKKKITGVLDPELFEAPDQVGAESGEGSVDDNFIPLPDSSASTSTNILRQSALDERESSLAERESTVIGLESSLNVRESSIAERESIIAGRESVVAERESSLDIRESSFTSRESSIIQHESAISANTSEIQRRMVEVQQRELEVDKRESEVKKREQDVSEREIRVERREEEMREWKLAENEKAFVVPVDDTPISTSTSTPTATSTWLPSPIKFARRLCATFLLPVLGKERTPGFLLRDNNSVDECASFTTSAPAASSSTTPPPATPPPLISSRSLRSGFFLNRLLGVTGRGSYFVLVSIGVCVVLLRGIIRRILRVGGLGRDMR